MSLRFIANLVGLLSVTVNLRNYVAYILRPIWIPRLNQINCTMSFKRSLSCKLVTREYAVAGASSLALVEAT